MNLVQKTYLGISKFQPLIGGNIKQTRYLRFEKNCENILQKPIAPNEGFAVQKGISDKSNSHLVVQNSLKVRCFVKMYRDLLKEQIGYFYGPPS